jgi:Leucine-rich repeat (LRR) protein
MGSDDDFPGSAGVPAAPMQLLGLQVLSLAYNDTVGTIPAAIGQLTNLEHLELYKNRLSGSIPPQISNLHQLAYLHIGANPRLIGSIPNGFASLSKLKNFDLSGNVNMSGKLPAFNFSQFAFCCSLNDIPFQCPLPAGATKCTGGTPAHPSECSGTHPTPTCK